MNTLAIIGGGAAGLAAAVEAARCARQRGADLRITVYEADEKVGRSILRSGNGRCNFSNAHIQAWDEAALAELYHNSDFVAQALQALECSASVRSEKAATSPAPEPAVAPALAALLAEAPAPALAAPDAPDPDATPTPLDDAQNQVQAFFRDLGLAWRQEGEGRLYPYANKAQSLLDAMRAALARHDVEVRLESPVTSVEPPRNAGGRMALRMADGSFERADQVIVAVGGNIAVSLLADLAKLNPLRPVLGPLAAWPAFEDQGESFAQLERTALASAIAPSRKSKKARGGNRKRKQQTNAPSSAVLNSLDNIRVRCAVRLERPDDQGRRTLVSAEQGEVLFRKYGLSGIAVFNLSRFAQAGDALSIDLLPELTLEQAAAWLRRRSASGQTAAAMLQGFLLPNVARAVCKAAGVRGDAPIGPADVELLARACKSLQFQVQGTGDEKQCQVHRGGVATDQVNPRTLQLASAPQIRVVGEALDVDAPCGGYNLHWAWGSALLAARSAVADL